MVTYFVGVDIGGTFTDCVALSTEGQILESKVLTNIADPAQGVVRGIEALAAAAGLSMTELLASTARFGHGTTIGTNALIERKGARTALITTAGHRDALLMMRGGGRVAGLPPEQFYSVHNTKKPEPLVHREAIGEVMERIDSEGNVVVALEDADAREVISALSGRQSFESIAICLLWSFVNPTHEQQLAGLLADMRPKVFVSLSSDVAPRLGEYERTVATVINSYVGPRSTEYLEHMDRQLHAQGLDRQILVMQSNGGVLPVSAVKKVPIRIIDSGPVGGLAGSAALARHYGHDNVVATDMGGTSFDVGLIFRGEPVVASERVIGQFSYRTPHLDVRSIACGGGSIAHVDEFSRSLRVGPESAGSEPGPACYGRGGEQPTVTDANLVLGFLRPDALLGGNMQLDTAAAHKAIESIAQRVGLSAVEAAAGIIRINNNNASSLIRRQTLERGYDTRDFVLYAYGGAGPVNAVGYAANLGIATIVIPLANGASTLSAYGIASSDIVQVFELEENMLAPFDPARLTAALNNVENRIHASFQQIQVYEHMVIERFVLMRYPEQYMQQLSVPIPNGQLGQSDCDHILTAFDTEYQRQFGSGARAVFNSPEIFAVSIKGSVKSELLKVIPSGAGIETTSSLDDSRRDGRKVYWPEYMDWIPTAVFDGTLLPPKCEIEGPARVELPNTSISIAPGQRGTVDASGSIIISL
jgi:N-methylhydantoinase A